MNRRRKEITLIRKKNSKNWRTEQKLRGGGDEVENGIKNNRKEEIEYDKKVCWGYGSESIVREIEEMGAINE